MKTYCSHYWGREYAMADGSKATCYFTLDGVKEAYEVSFVAVPAQPRAGTTKHYGGVPEEKPETTPETETKNIENEKTDARLFAQRVKNAESFFNAEREEK